MKFTTANLAFGKFCNDVIYLDINEVHDEQPWPGCKEVVEAVASSYCPFELHGDYVEIRNGMAYLKMIKNKLIMIWWMFKHQNMLRFGGIIKMKISITNPKNKNKGQNFGKMNTKSEVKFEFMVNKIYHMKIEFLAIILIILMVIMDIIWSQIKNMGQDFCVMTWFFN
jgi:hypothetical protein